MKRKEFVHNELEAITIVRESFNYGNEDKYFDCEFYSHNGEYLFKTYTYYMDFKIVYQDKSEKFVNL